jgi:hypothetical protein
MLYSRLSLGLPSRVYPSGFSHQKPVCTFSLSHAGYMPRQSHSYRFDHPNNFGRGVQII